MLAIDKKEISQELLFTTSGMGYQMAGRVGDFPI